MRPYRIGLAVFAAAALGAAAPAGATIGGMTPVPAPSGCLMANPGSTGCGDAGPLDYGVEIEISGDGRNAYALGFQSHTLLVYDVDPLTGALTRRTGAGHCFFDRQATAPPVDCTAARGLHNATELAFSPSQDHLYTVASPGTIGVFKRASNGGLTQEGGANGCITTTNPAAYGADPCRVGHHLANTRGIAAYGDHLYVTTNGASSEGDGVVVLDATPGGLEQDPGAAGCVIQTGGGSTGCADGRGLIGAEQIAISPDGLNVYVTGFDGQSVAALERSSNGDLRAITEAGGCLAATSADGCTVVEHMGAGEGILVSRDGKHVYFTTRTGPQTLQFADRQPNGTLIRRSGTDGCIHGQGGTVTNCRFNRGVLLPFRLVESQDGRFIYLASVFANSVTAYLRASDGVLAPIADRKGCVFAGTFSTCLTGPGLNGPQGLAISPDGRFLYTASVSDDSITQIKRDAAAPVCTDAAATVPGGNAVSLPLDCSDADGDAVTITVLSNPAGGILGNVDQANRTVPFIAGQAATTTSFTFRATGNDVASNVATYALEITAASPPPPPPPPGSAACEPRPEVAGNGIDEDCNGFDLPTPPVTPLEVTVGKIRPLWTTFTKYTILRRLRIGSISPGAGVEIRCRGKGCPFRRKTFRPRRGRVDASASFRRKRLRPRTRVEVRIVKPGAVAKVVIYTVARGKVPRPIVRCLPVGATKPIAC